MKQLAVGTVFSMYLGISELWTRFPMIATFVVLTTRRDSYNCTIARGKNFDSKIYIIWTYSVFGIFAIKALWDKGIFHINKQYGETFLLWFFPTYPDYEQKIIWVPKLGSESVINFEDLNFAAISVRQLSFKLFIQIWFLYSKFHTFRKLISNNINEKNSSNRFCTGYHNISS